MRHKLFYLFLAFPLLVCFCYDDGDGEISILEAENIENVNCSGRSISSLSLGNNVALSYLDCSSNALSALNVENVTGVLFDAANPKIVSVSMTSAIWDSAKTWCSSLGEGWYLPDLNELKAIYNVRNSINATLSSIGETDLGTPSYWSSTEDNSSLAFTLSFNDGGTYYGNKSFSFSVRAVRAL